MPIDQNVIRVVSSDNTVSARTDQTSDLMGSDTRRPPSPPKPPYVLAKQQWRAFAEQDASARRVSPRIGLASTFTADSLVPMLGAGLLDLGFSPEVLNADYNQIFQVCLEPAAHFSGEIDAIILMWRIEDLLAEEFVRFIKGDHSALDDAKGRVDELIQAVTTLRQSFSRTIIVSLPPFPNVSTCELLDLDTPTNAGRFHRVITEYSASGLAAAPQIRILDLDSLQRSFGAQSAFDVRKWQLYRQPFSEPFL